MVERGRRGPRRSSNDEAAAPDEYDDRFRRLAAAGHDVHGEASFIASYRPRRVLDAGCGSGRVAIELSRRGVSCVGLDLDHSMLVRARDKAPDVEWFQGDLSSFELRGDDGRRRRFDVVVAAGNVMIFLAPGTERRAVTMMARHLVPGGLLIAGFQLLAGGYALADYDADCEYAGLEPFARFGSWQRGPWTLDGRYAVVVHRRPGVSGDQPAQVG